MAFDVMGHLKLREVRHWDRYDTTGNDTYINNRRQGWQYDADGRLISGNARYVYDAAGQISSFDDFGESKTEQQLDGDGRRIRSEHKVYNLNTNQWSTDETKYYIHSSVLGQLITELNTTDGTDRSFVYAGGKILAIIHLNGGTPQFTTWEHYDPNGGSYRSTYSQGDEAGGAEMDPLGADAGMMKPIVWNPPTGPGKLEPYYGIPELSSASSGCILDGIQVPCDMVTNDKAVQCENNQCKRGTEFFRAFSDGYSGYLQADARYLGDGLATSERAANGSLDELAGIVSLERNHAGSLPQHPDPTKISGDRNNKQCSLTVSFEPGNFDGVEGFPNGPSDWVHPTSKKTIHGLGFTVTVTVPKGDAVSKMGDTPVPSGATGNWVVDQWTSNWSTREGLLLRDGHGTPMQGGPSQRDIDILTPVLEKGNQFSWWDHPGSALDRTYGNWQFFVKAYKGEQHCEAMFWMTVREDGSIHWGQGTLPQ